MLYITIFFVINRSEAFFEGYRKDVKTLTFEVYDKISTQRFVYGVQT